jgi:hypothetical protein
MPVINVNRLNAFSGGLRIPIKEIEEESALKQLADQ